MKMHPFIPFLLVTVLFVAGACESSMDGAIASVAGDSDVPSSAGDMRYLPAVEPEAIQAMLSGMTPKERKAFTDSSLIAGSTVVSETRRAIEEAGTWQEADEKVRLVLTKHAGRTAYLAEQFAALEMLDVVLLRERVTPDVQEAIAFYTQHLLEHESPDASVVLRALRALKGTWPEEVRRQGASATARYAEVWLATIVGAGKAVDTTLEGQPHRGGLLDVQSRRLVLIRGAVAALQELGQ